MKEGATVNPTATLIRSLPTLSKERLRDLWLEHLGKPTGKIRFRLMLSVLAYRIQEKATEA